MPTAAHSSDFMEEHGYLYAFKLALKYVAQTLQCLYYYYYSCSK